MAEWGQNTFGTAAYGGENWSQRIADHREELAADGLWGPCGQDSEWKPLKQVLLHRPGEELAASHDDPDKVQMLAPIDVAKAAAEHDAMAEAFRAQGVTVHYVDPAGAANPNQMFCADLMFMTPEGVILARPASTVRAGEEIEVQRRLSDLRIPAVRTLRGEATFEGADAMWLDAHSVILGIGHRTNEEAAHQIGRTLEEMGVETIPVDMPFGTMHLMGMLRFADRDLAICWPRRTPHGAVRALQDRSYRVAFIPDLDNHTLNRSMNFVTLGPRRILLEKGYPEVQGFYESLGIECVTVEAQELVKAAGGFGCLTGIVEREI
ncbi:MAG: arginine deiminase family protein [Alphaproteobacteria bacterium]|nr:arginine deiminase family protein [Alphaproteobacteria bacterium]